MARSMLDIVRIWCLPKEAQDTYEVLWQSIVQAMMRHSETLPEPIVSQDDMLVLLPSDLMEAGLGEAIWVEAIVRDVFTDAICESLMGTFCHIVQNFNSKSGVIVTIDNGTRRFQRYYPPNVV